MKLVREPLIHFLVLGALIFGASRFLAPHGEYRIEAGQVQRARLASMYRQQYGSPPTRGQLESLLDQYVRSEILYREGLALGLDRGDEIVRRRVVQKIEFLNQDAAETGTDEAQLRRYFHEHHDRYADAANVSFTHLYFSPDAGGDERAKGRAELAWQAWHAARGLRKPG